MLVRDKIYTNSLGKVVVVSSEQKIALLNIILFLWCLLLPV
jgi:hypothetical protein